MLRNLKGGGKLQPVLPKRKTFVLCNVSIVSNVSNQIKLKKRRLGRYLMMMEWMLSLGDVLVSGRRRSMSLSRAVLEMMFRRA